MRLNGYEQMPLEGCSGDYQSNALRCVSSYKWCESKKKTIDTSIISPMSTADWKIYRNEKYGFEVKYPENWVVNYDEARYPESDESYPRFIVTELGPIKDLKCYASFIFKDLGGPEKNTYSLFSEADKKQECQQVLDRILSTFRFLD